MAFRTSHNMRAYYSADLFDFLQQSTNEILGIIHTNDASAETTIQQSNTWEAEVKILKDQLRNLDSGRIIFEYTIPRLGHPSTNSVYICRFLYRYVGYKKVKQLTP